MLSALKKIHQDNSGVIMITVLILVLALTVVAIGILSVNISQVSTSQSVVDTIRAEQVAIGAFYQYHQQKIDGTGTSLNSVTIDGKIFDISIVPTPPVCNPTCNTPNDTNQVDVTVTFSGG